MASGKRPERGRPDRDVTSIAARRRLQQGSDMTVRAALSSMRGKRTGEDATFVEGQRPGRGVGGAAVDTELMP
jgi:hypothetical protein